LKFGAFWCIMRKLTGRTVSGRPKTGKSPERFALGFTLEKGDYEKENLYAKQKNPSIINPIGGDCCFVL